MTNKDLPAELQRQLIQYLFEAQTAKRDPSFWVPPTNVLKDFSEEELEELSYIIKTLKVALTKKDYTRSTFTTSNRVAQVLRDHQWYVKKLYVDMFEIRNNLRNYGEQAEAKRKLLGGNCNED